MCAHSAAVVNEACQVSTFGGINDGVMIDAEQVTAPDSFLSVTLLTIISHHLKSSTHHTRVSTQQQDLPEDRLMGYLKSGIKKQELYMLYTLYHE